MNLSAANWRFVRRAAELHYLNAAEGTKIDPETQANQGVTETAGEVHSANCLIGE